MPSEFEITVNSKPLQMLLKSITGKLPKARVGILGDKNARQGKNSNATIGLKHEFGDDKVPQRSFLRTPLQEYFGKYLENASLLDENAVKKILKTGTIIDVINIFGQVGRNVVLDGFHTAGFGKWKPHAKGYTNRTGQILVDTTQLRNSITWDLEE